MKTWIFTKDDFVKSGHFDPWLDLLKYFEVDYNDRDNVDTLEVYVTGHAINYGKPIVD